MTSSLTELRPPPTLPSTPPTPAIRTKRTPSKARYWAAAIVAVLGLTAAFVWGAVGPITSPEPVDSVDCTANRGPVPAPRHRGAYNGAPPGLARYATPTATGRPATRWNPATDATIEVS